MPAEQAECEPPVAAGLAAVQAAIAEAARVAGREPAEVTLVAVTKTHPAAAILPALQAGHRTFGENRVQEAEAKWPELKAAYPDLVLHLIGPLQRNKARRAVRLFDVIESIDRADLAQAVAQAAEAEGRRPAVFIQVNTGEEPQKAGVFPDATDALVEVCRAAGLDLRGLMCIPPVDEEPSLHFALLREIARRNGLKGLSMGMSGDFPVAVQFGATHVRVGTAIFGYRPPTGNDADRQ
ncbi:YggS family pyridoxal phosphate-dependent enzyme [Defluviicoccus vanus]|uniref:Pyridoxal phosphate homeostasis protein n=1 Tax=Defluviicoccus vanus TaxID=111831 RepID=A0A7H1N1K6_9PROT|nr:YggS family pyridoxal phosphate-dependent enzyme [Defluviicoccus vanus]QNT69592.1 YggS family pyridoxal phosphate-dependent enzyme [Defluviicoccus vanus]